MCTAAVGFGGYRNLLIRPPIPKRKVFVSYYHRDDQFYKNYFCEFTKDIFTHKSVENGDIMPDNSTEYIKRLIQTDCLSDTSVLILLIGPNTWKRKHVDWEISGALNSKIRGRSGVIGLFLPEHPCCISGKFSEYDTPPRFCDNERLGYATKFYWKDAMASVSRIQEIVENAVKIKNDARSATNNSRLQYNNNRP